MNVNNQNSFQDDQNLEILEIKDQNEEMPQQINTQQSESNEVNNAPKKNNENIIIMILSIINLILLIYPGGYLFLIAAIVLLVFSIKGLKTHDVKAVISLVINMITILLTLALFVVAFKKVNETFNTAKATAFKLEANSIVTDVKYKYSGFLTGQVSCSSILNQDLSKYESCTLNFGNDDVSITIKTNDGYCIYNGTSTNMDVELCK